MMIQTGGGGRGSIPEIVMRTGVILPFNPNNARQDINTRRVIQETSTPTGVNPSHVMPILPAPLPIAPQTPMTAAIAATTTAAPPVGVTPATKAKPMGFPFPDGDTTPVYSGMLGEWNGRPMATFKISAAPPRGGAEAAAGALKRSAQLLREAGYGSLPPQLVAGPLAALMRGGAIELHFNNGAVVRTSL